MRTHLEPDTMQMAHKSPAIRAVAQPAAEIAADLLIIPIFADDDLADEPGLDAASGNELTRARDRGELTGKLFETLPISLSGWKTSRAVLVGIGGRNDLTRDHLRRVAIVGSLAARQRRITKIAILHRAGTPVSAEDASQAIVEGLLLANFDGGSFRTSGPPTSWIETADVRVAGDRQCIEQSITRGRVMGEYSNEARALANAPGNELTPRVFADRAAAIAAAAGLTTDVLDEHRLDALKMGLLLGVARGSQEPPRLVVLKHDPPDAIPGAVLGLVGKGITFDTGGISIKPADNMDKMKDDMSGGAAVVCAMAAIARLEVPVRCIGIVPMTENMPGGRAVKPGDVLTSASGKTVEIINTDAEGRLVLGDGLWYARELGATHLVDVATLTGACVIALGKTTSGVFGTPDTWVESVRRAGERAGERSWPLPVFDDYKEQLKSEIADFTNSGGRSGGAITAALFLKEFTADHPWVHIDIAGTAWAEEAKPYQPKGATGVGVRTLVELALDATSWSRGA
ncbi:MAG TPA: leucyl aminopeptidase [Vicinamibacterales bacterium]|nr:leucyl aminopeptidase [Vicinamibacterales bacterium]